MTNKQFRKKLKKLKRNIRQYIVDKKLEKCFEKCEKVYIFSQNSFFEQNVVFNHVFQYCSYKNICIV